MTKRQIMLLSLIVTCLAGCKSAAPKPAVVETYQAMSSEVAGTAVPPQSIETVRVEENVRIYQTGRYIDPGDPNVMHEASTLYVLADSAAWNTSPNYSPLEPQFNRRTNTATLSADMMLQIAELKKTNELMVRLGNELARSRKQLADAEKRLEKANGDAALRIKKLEAELSRSEQKRQLMTKELADIHAKLIGK